MSGMKGGRGKVVLVCKSGFKKINRLAYNGKLRPCPSQLVKISTIKYKHNLLSRNQSKVRTVGYGGGRVNVSSSTKYYRMLLEFSEKTTLGVKYECSAVLPEQVHLV